MEGGGGGEREGQVLPLLLGVTWCNSQKAQISLPTMPSQSSALTSLSPLQKPPGAYSPKIPTLHSTGASHHQTKLEGVENQSRGGPLPLHAAGLSKVGAEILGSTRAPNSAVQPTLPDLRCSRLSPAGRAGRAAVQVGKGSDYGLEAVETFPFSPSQRV